MALRSCCDCHGLGNASEASAAPSEAMRALQMLLMMTRLVAFGFGEID